LYVRWSCSARTIKMFKSPRIKRRHRRRTSSLLRRPLMIGRPANAASSSFKFKVHHAGVSPKANTVESNLFIIPARRFSWFCTRRVLLSCCNQLPITVAADEIVAQANFLQFLSTTVFRNTNCRTALILYESLTIRAHSTRTDCNSYAY
jgi:hypothetical protein